jgi:preprotein translocase subunit SecF
MHIVERRKLWFIISILAIIPGLVYMLWSLATQGTLLPLSIDFTGGTVWDMRFQQTVEPGAVRQIFVDAGFDDTSAFTFEDGRAVEVKFKPVDAAQKEQLRQAITDQVGPFEELAYRSLGPTIGGETARAAILAVAAASVLILLYIAWAFRQVPHPFRFGTAAVIALVHDVLVVISFICIMNLIAGWEFDALTLTAILTVIGFSVTDTVVVFDRIRENLRRYRGESLADVSNRSILETATRSIATQITALLVLVALLVLGGATLQQFVATLIVGFISGMYSSIFNATPLLVAWDEKALFHRGPLPSASSGRPVPA